MPAQEINGSVSAVTGEIGGSAWDIFQKQIPPLLPRRHELPRTKKLLFRQEAFKAHSCQNFNYRRKSLVKVSLGLSTLKSFIATKWFSAITSAAFHIIFCSNIFLWVAKISESLPVYRIKLMTFLERGQNPTAEENVVHQKGFFSLMMSIKEIDLSRKKGFPQYWVVYLRLLVS